MKKSKASASCSMRNFLKIFILVSLFAFLGGCKEKEVSIPPHILSKGEMVQILADLHVSEAAVIHGKVSNLNGERLFESFRLGILKKHGLSLEKFEESYNFYLSDPMLLDLLYIDVITEISKRQAELSAPVDSIH
jgi:hypothetical protein